VATISYNEAARRIERLIEEFRQDTKNFERHLEDLVDRGETALIILREDREAERQRLTMCVCGHIKNQHEYISPHMAMNCRECNDCLAFTEKKDESN